MVTSDHRPGRLWIDRFGLPELGGLGAFLIALAVDALGSGLFASFSLLYFHDFGGMSLPKVGLALTAATAVGLVANPVAGELVDRIGAKPVVVSSQFVQAAGYVGFLFVHSISALLLAALPVVVGIRIFWVAFPALVADIAASDQRDRWYGLTGAAQSAGLGAGGLIAAGVVAIGGVGTFRWLLLGNAASFVIAGVLLWLRLPAIGKPAGAAGKDGGYRSVLSNRPYVAFAAASIVFAACCMMITYAVPIYVVDELGAAAWIVGGLFAVNTLLLALQPLVVGRLTRFRRTRVMAAAGAVWVVSFALFAVAGALPGRSVVPFLFAVTAVYTLGETLFAPISSALAAGAGPEEMRGKYIALLSLSWGIAHAASPALVTALFTLSPAAPWTVAAVFAAAASVVMLRVERGLPAVALRSGGRGSDASGRNQDDRAGPIRRYPESRTAWRTLR